MTALGQATDCQMEIDGNNSSPTNLDWFRDAEESSVAAKCNEPTIDEPTIQQQSDHISDASSPPSLSETISSGSNDQATKEESTKEALLLKRKELKWKLMQASQAQNKLKLDEFKTAYHYHKQKLSKAEDLAAKLRSKYLKVVESARLSEIQLKKVEGQLALQEKYVAHEKMQITRIALDCTRSGAKLYGSSYKLPTNKQITSSDKRAIPKLLDEMNKKQPGDMQNQPEQTSEIVSEEVRQELLKNLSPFLRRARTAASSDTGESETIEIEEASPNVIIDDLPTVYRKIKVNGPSVLPTKRRKKLSVSRLSPLFDVNDSILKNMASYRLTRKFAETSTNNLTDLRYAHNISPLEYICLPDLLGTCSDKSCAYQHKSNYLMTDLERLTDLLSYRPSVADFRPDPDLGDEENYRICRVKLKQFAARLISKHAENPVETIAESLIDSLRADEPDDVLLTKRRYLPKVVHLKKQPHPAIELSCGDTPETCPLKNPHPGSPTTQNSTANDNPPIQMSS